jgi:DNA replication protein DnaC
MQRNEKCWYKDICTTETNCNESCVRYVEMKYLIDHSGLEEYRAQKFILDPANFNDNDKSQLRKISRDIKRIVKFVEEGTNLFIGSENTGNGKTTIATKYLLNYFDKIWNGNGFRIRGLFIHVPTFLNDLKNWNNPLSQEYLNAVKTTDLVVWDDIAYSKLSDFEYTQLLVYLDARIMGKRANIYTSNVVDENKLAELLGERIVSRIHTNSNKYILTGKDFRQVGMDTVRGKK